MSHSFIAYIDESGDDGLGGRYKMLGQQGGSSNWLGIGATIWRTSRDLDMVNCAQEILGKLPKSKKRSGLHFKALRHEQRVMAISTLAKEPFRTSAVFAYKPIIPEGIYTERNRLYHYMTRYLIERLSWICRDFRRYVPEGDGRLKIVFSRRGGMDYDDFQQYLQLLKDMSDPTVRIHWPVVDIEAVQAHDHGSRYGLQLADLAVSGLRAALEPDLYGNVEPRFAEILRPLVYQRGPNCLSYGAKLVPSPEEIQNFDGEAIVKPDLSHWLRLFG